MRGHPGEGPPIAGLREDREVGRLPARRDGEACDQLVRFAARREQQFGRGDLGTDLSHVADRGQAGREIVPC